MIDRYEWMSRLAEALPEDSLVMSTMIGAVGFEWGAITDEHARTCMLGHMGCVIGLATGLALALPHRKVICLDGDGSAMLELGQLVALGQETPDNLVVFVADNGVYESIGTTAGKTPRPTATAGKVELAAIALGAGVPYAKDVSTMEDFEQELAAAMGRTRMPVYQRPHQDRPFQGPAAPARRDGGQVPLRPPRRADRGHPDHDPPGPGPKVDVSDRPRIVERGAVIEDRFDGCVRRRLLEAFNSGTSAFFVFLRGSAPDATGAFEHAISKDRNRPLPEEHVATLRRNDSPRGRMVGPFG